MKITRIFTFSAAHHLTRYRGECSRPHGHTYELAVTVEGKMRKNGLVMDFAELKKIVNEKILAKLDHSDLNDMFPNPSAEAIAIWIWEQMKDVGKGLTLAEIKLWEGDNTYVAYDGN